MVEAISSSLSFSGRHWIDCRRTTSVAGSWRILFWRRSSSFFLRNKVGWCLILNSSRSQIGRYCWADVKNLGRELHCQHLDYSFDWCLRGRDQRLALFQRRSWWRVFRFCWRRKVIGRKSKWFSYYLKLQVVIICAFDFMFGMCAYSHFIGLEGWGVPCDGLGIDLSEI